MFGELLILAIIQPCSHTLTSTNQSQKCAVSLPCQEPLFLHLSWQGDQDLPAEVAVVMSEKKKRVRTGCLTCRQRRVKCDEGKPFCDRCKSANVSCSGYQTPRHVQLKKRGSSNAASGQLQILQAAFTPIKSNEYFAYPTEESQRPHDQARLVLAHHQYTLRTVNLLFRDEHLYFWRDHVSRVGWDTQYVFDAIVALGTMHRSALLLSKPNDKWRGLDTKVIGFNAYGNALKQISGQSGDGNPRDPEMLIAVLILLTYFEVSLVILEIVCRRLTK